MGTSESRPETDNKKHTGTAEAGMADPTSTSTRWDQALDRIAAERVRWREICRSCPTAETLQEMKEALIRLQREESEILNQIVVGVEKDNHENQSKRGAKRLTGTTTARMAGPTAETSQIQGRSGSMSILKDNKYAKEKGGPSTPSLQEVPPRRRRKERDELNSLTGDLNLEPGHGSRKSSGTLLPKENPHKRRRRTHNSNGWLEEIDIDLTLVSNGGDIHSTNYSRGSMNSPETNAPVPIAAAVEEPGDMDPDTKTPLSGADTIRENQEKKLHFFAVHQLFDKGDTTNEEKGREDEVCPDARVGHAFSDKEDNGDGDREDQRFQLDDAFLVPIPIKKGYDSSSEQQYTREPQDKGNNIGIGLSMDQKESPASLAPLETEDKSAKKPGAAQIIMNSSDHHCNIDELGGNNGSNRSTRRSRRGQKPKKFHSCEDYDFGKGRTAQKRPTTVLGHTGTHNVDTLPESLPESQLLGFPQRSAAALKPSHILLETNLPFENQQAGLKETQISLSGQEQTTLESQHLPQKNSLLASAVEVEDRVRTISKSNYGHRNDEEVTNENKIRWERARKKAIDELTTLRQEDGLVKSIHIAAEIMWMVRHSGLPS